MKFPVHVHFCLTQSVSQMQAISLSFRLCFIILSLPLLKQTLLVDLELAPALGHAFHFILRLSYHICVFFVPLLSFYLLLLPFSFPLLKFVQLELHVTAGFSDKRHGWRQWAKLSIPWSRFSLFCSLSHVLLRIQAWASLTISQCFLSCISQGISLHILSCSSTPFCYILSGSFGFCVVLFAVIIFVIQIALFITKFIT